jgi:hypothetical protein
VTVSGDGLSLNRPARLLEARYDFVTPGHGWDIAPDGRILIPRVDEADYRAWDERQEPASGCTSCAPEISGKLLAIENAPPKADLLAGRKQENGGPDRDRTCDKRFRKPLLYPTELRAPEGRG